MQTLAHIKQLLNDRGIRPQHRWGQNFLHDQNNINKLLNAVNLTQGDLVVEVGPGTGTLTESLLAKGAKVIACEIDYNMVGIIEDTLKPRYPENLTIITGDCMASKHSLNDKLINHLDCRSFYLVANLPYQVAGILIGTLLVDFFRPEILPRCMGTYITIQKEVAQRVMAKPSNKDYGPLAVLCGAIARVELISTLSPNCFWPIPKVNSSMISIIPDNTKSLSINPPEFRDFLQRLFSQRRKQLGHILGRSGTLPNTISLDLRPEQLTVDQLITLAGIFIN